MMDFWAVVIFVFIFDMTTGAIRWCLQYRRDRRNKEAEAQRHSELEGRLKGLEQKLEKLRLKLGNADLVILPKQGSVLALADRLQQLGYCFEGDGDEPWRHADLPESIRDSFAAEEYGDRVIATCPSCMDQRLGVVATEQPVLHPGLSLGLFCQDCGKGRLFSEVNNMRKAAGLAELPDHQLMAVIVALEAEAKKSSSHPLELPAGGA